MTLHIMEGNIFESKVEALVVPVNCAGVMGSRLLREAKERWPGNYRYYRKVCQYGHITKGNVLVYNLDMVVKKRGVLRCIINMPTKMSPNTKSDMEWIRSGLTALGRVVSGMDIRSIAIPALACGKGGLGWEEIREQVDIVVNDLFPEYVEVYLYQPIENK